MIFFFFFSETNKENTQKLLMHPRKQDSKQIIINVNIFQLMSNSPLTETFKKLLSATDAVLLHYSKQCFMVPFHLPAYKLHTYITCNSISPGFWALGSVCSLGTSRLGRLACCPGPEGFLCSFCCVGQVDMRQVHTFILSTHPANHEHTARHKRKWHLYFARVHVQECLSGVVSIHST